MAGYVPVIVVIVAIGDAYIAVEYNEKHDSVLAILCLDRSPCCVLHKCRYVFMQVEEKVFLLFISAVMQYVRHKHQIIDIPVCLSGISTFARTHASSSPGC